jgi:hypothetical protein
MNRGLLLCALALGLVLPASAPAAATDAESPTTTSAEAVLATATVDPALLPPDPDVVTDAELAGVGASPAVQQLSNDPNQLVVDDDLAQCPNADFTSPAGIQAAIEAAPPGTKIRVCPGNYSPVDVHKADLWIQAPLTHGQANECRQGDPAQDAFIEGSHPLGLVQITASGVRFEGFIVQGNTSGPGVRTSPTGSGYALTFNDVRLNKDGIDLNTNGTIRTEITHSCIRDNSENFRGVASSSGFSNVLIANNMFTGMQEPVINCLAFDFPPVCVPVADVTFTHNDLVDTGSVIFQTGNGVTISFNSFRRPLGASVILNNTVGVDVSFNHIDGQDQPTGQGIVVVGDEGVGLNAIVRNNKVEHLCCGLVIGPNLIDSFGIAVNGAGVAVMSNWVQFNRGTGINLRGPRAVGNRIEGNLVVGNGIPGTDLLLRASDGIRINTGAVGNTIENNRLRDNVDHDCHDNNPNGANVWRHNVGETENQPGLCVRRP